MKLLTVLKREALLEGGGRENKAVEMVAILAHCSL